MIISMGVDIVEIDEMKNSILQSDRFLKRVFTEKEINYCENRINNYSSYAARFAAKEAVMKALGTGWDKGIQWKHIEVLNMNEYKSNKKIDNITSGKPEILLHAQALQLSLEMRVKNIIVSLSHSKNYAMATVLFQI